MGMTCTMATSSMLSHVSTSTHSDRLSLDVSAHCTSAKKAAVDTPSSHRHPTSPVSCHVEGSQRPRNRFFVQRSGCCT